MPSRLKWNASPRASALRLSCSLSRQERLFPPRPRMNTCRCSDRALDCRSYSTPLLNERHVILLKAVHHELVIPIGTTRIAPREGSIGPRSFDMGQQRVRRDAVRLRHPGELTRQSSYFL